ncbi:MAG: hypothetical protein R3304_03555 [Longimicrobiales bacterium]|nr:hypothetical protein [Longimicrobiales bacterium]
MVELLRWTFAGAEGAAGRVVLSWIMAGGICGGGLLIGMLALVGGGSPGLHLLLAPVLFLGGSVLGFLNGLGLAVLTRPESASMGEALRRGLTAVAVALPLLPLAWLVASSVSVATALQVERRISWIVVSAGGTLVGLAICGVAVREGIRSISSAMSERRERRSDTTVVRYTAE